MTTKDILENVIEEMEFNKEYSIGDINSMFLNFCEKNNILNKTSISPSLSKLKKEGKIKQKSIGVYIKEN